MKALLPILLLTAAVALAQNVKSLSDGRCVYVADTAAQKARADAVVTPTDFDKAQAQANAVKAALARLKASAATNQDIADILLLLKAINSQFQ